MNNYFSRILLLFLLGLGLCGTALATTPPTGRPLAEVLNPDGTLKAGTNGSFDARAFRMRTAPDGRPVFSPMGTTGTGDERWADGFGLPNGASEVVQTVVRAGTDVYIGGNFTAVGNVAANRLARWNGTTWSSLGTGAANGVNAGVLSLVVAGNGDVYAGGYFTQAGGAAANNIARWDGTAWSTLGTGAANGVNGNVNALAIAVNGDVYAGGRFTQAGGAAASSIARWNGTAWSSLGTGAANGVNVDVRALAMAGNGDVYAGGGFTVAGGVAAVRVARWNGTAWSSLGSGAANGVNLDVCALAIAVNGDVYAGGYFTQAGGAAANNIARWNGTAWSSLGSGAANGVNAGVLALVVAGNGDVYAGGRFTLAGGAAAGGVARWNGTAWSSLGSGATNGVNADVVALAVAGNGAVYAGGGFTLAGGATANRVARWNGTAWSNLGTGPANGVNGYINALVVAGNGDVYAGGYFTQAGGAAANNIARWNGTAWSSLGSGAANGVNSYVNALAIAVNGDVYAGGNFTQAGGVAAGGVACWNGTAWSNLGTGPVIGVTAGVVGGVNALAIAGNGDVYAGGGFTQTGGEVPGGVARRNGTAWSSLGTGLATGTFSSYVFALAIAVNGDVYAGGNFTQAGGVATGGVARWNGTAWSSLGSGTANGVNGYINALVVAGNGDVYAGGRFTQAGGAAANSIARWNGTAWSSLGSGAANGVNGNARTLVLAGSGDVYAGGGFTRAGGVAAGGVARWNGTAWSNLGTGNNDIIFSMATGPTGKLYIGGDFTATGDGSKVMVNFGIYDPNAPLATKATAAMPAAQLFPNPAHGTATLRLPASTPRLPLTLTDALGRTVRCYPAPAGPDAALDLRGVPAGVYVVGCGQLTQRLVVE
ncbi:T9SS type A sorting domain-containing protein [Hymenobacter arizonensis]|uniref:Por secretion system C-terminal sorting domain-containing protein n=1 Tax=Hymenobacter arizonensis TaxID=1227077 RepID=A0A1I5Z1B4_HYMAR|nr:T9SS type A sorting domain-containing protein [Hymenobacter arizonensis]SFQ50304.1 hypothetical protein SAMN04515668_2609 [Hymenobacter arizonensis]